MTLLALSAVEFAYLPPICLAIALVTSAARRDDMRGILKQAARSWLILTVGIVIFMLALSYGMEWLLPA